ncbi:MAG: HAMP domain-containing protein [Bacteroidetes bacterium]|nr:HAMP domain-containing protein [Bacteroidota bacterium]MBS1740428.1 HAMP domain-containing protein [Bacteroidota bacterium]
MKIKFKLTLAVGLLFVMIATLTTISAIYINRLSVDAKNIIKDNYNSVSYSREMLIALNNDISRDIENKRFLKYIEKEKNTITEVGEKELANNIEHNFNLLQKNTNDSALIQNIRKDITDVMLLNMQAIQKKSAVAEETSKNSIIIISVVGTFCFIIAFILLVNLPSNIANPISELTNSIKQIANKNYSERVHFESSSEFGDLAKSFNTMAQKLQEYTSSNLEKLLMSKKRIETLINNMSEPVIGLDETKNILFINDEALKISGLKGEEVIGKPVQDIAMYNDLIRSLIQDLFKPNPLRDEKKQPLKIFANNKESFFEKEIIPIKITPTGEDMEKHIGDVILLRNVTTYKELDLAKTNFIGTVSHEFKTPIASIKMSLQLLENEQIGIMNAEQKELITSIKEDTNRLLKFTGELLNMTQVESGSIYLELQPTDTTEIINYALNTVKQPADQKQIKINLTVEENLPKVVADKEKTAWVITNLLTNAIRYSHENSTITIQAIESKDKVRISVIDSGQGIAPEYLDKIFDRYFRVPGIKKEGTGLGLSISKEFIEAQGGSITVESEFGSGSRFNVELNSVQII